MSIYLRLFHGRDRVDQQLDDWGKDGPVLGPLGYVHTTYGGHIRVFNLADNDGHDIFLAEGMIRYGGIYYGDWSIMDTETVEREPALLSAVQPFIPSLI